MKNKFLDNKVAKIYLSPEYNYIFNKINGEFLRWGKTKDDDPSHAPFCEIADIEISTICNKGCAFCYKDNSSHGENMSFETFKEIFDKLPKQLTQIAFGIGDVDTNPDMWKIFDYSRQYGIIPNVTINGTKITPEVTDKLAKVCGAVAVSHYNDDDCFNAIKMLSESGLKQINIHKLLSEDTYEECLALLDKTKTDPRAKALNAIVFLLLKPKGRGVKLKPLKSLSKYKELIDYALDKEIGIGFDSCSAINFLKAIKGHPSEQQLTLLVEPCESTKFSFYIDVKGDALPCSFSADIEGIQPISMLGENTFDNIWNSETFIDFRNKNNNCKSCIIYDLDME